LRRVAWSVTPPTALAGTDYARILITPYSSHAFSPIRFRPVRSAISRKPHSNRPSSSGKPTDGPALLFDLDGTLVDSVYEHVLAWNDALQEEGIAYPNWSIHRRVGMSGEIFLKALLREIGAKASENQLKRILEIKKKNFMGRISEVQILPGARELLKRLSQLGVPWIIATSGGKEEVAPLLKLLRLQSKPQVVTGDDVKEAKPEPDIFLAAAKRLGVALNDCTIIGDSVWDLLAARRAKGLGVGLLCGGYGRAELDGAGAYRVYKDPAELLGHIEELGIHTDCRIHRNAG
jgi:HAD superfamily hydrolase (TIGR01549 family)